MTFMRGLRYIDGFDTEDEAREAQLAYAAQLVQRGDTKRFGVLARRLGPGPQDGWGVFLRDRLGTEDLSPTSKA